MLFGFEESGIWVNKTSTGIPLASIYTFVKTACKVKVDTQILVKDGVKKISAFF